MSGDRLRELGPWSSSAFRNPPQPETPRRMITNRRQYKFNRPPLPRGRNGERTADYYRQPEEELPFGYDLFGTLAEAERERTAGAAESVTAGCQAQVKTDGSERAKVEREASKQTRAAWVGTRPRLPAKKNYVPDHPSPLKNEVITDEIMVDERFYTPAAVFCQQPWHVEVPDSSDEEDEDELESMLQDAFDEDAIFEQQAQRERPRDASLKRKVSDEAEEPTLVCGKKQKVEQTSFVSFSGINRRKRDAEEENAATRPFMKPRLSEERADDTDFGSSSHSPQEKRKRHDDEDEDEDATVPYELFSKRCFVEDENTPKPIAGVRKSSFSKAEDATTPSSYPAKERHLEESTITPATSKRSGDDQDSEEEGPIAKR